MDFIITKFKIKIVIKAFQVAFMFKDLLLILIKIEQS